MIIPVRCFSCGKVVGNKWGPYLRHLRDGKTEEKALDSLGLRRYCCRRMLVAHVERIDTQLIFDASKDPSQKQNVTCYTQNQGTSHRVIAR